MSYEPIKVPGKAFLTNLFPSKHKNFPLAPTMVAPQVDIKYDLISLEEMLSCRLCCSYHTFFITNILHNSYSKTTANKSCYTNITHL